MVIYLKKYEPSFFGIVIFYCNSYENQKEGITSKNWYYYV